MDTKGIEFLNPHPVPMNRIDMDKKDIPAIKPIEAISKSLMDQVLNQARPRDDDQSTTNLYNDWPPEKVAKAAKDLLTERLGNSKNLEVDWKFDQKHAVLVIQVKDKHTGEVIRQVPPEDVLKGFDLFKPDSTGALLDKKA